MESPYPGFLGDYENKFGRVTSGSAGDDIIPNGTVTFPAAAGAMTIESSHADDDGSPAGDGMQTARVWYLDSNGKLAGYKDAILNGVTPVALGVSGLFAFRIRGLTYGANGTNTGNIIVKVGTDVVCEATALFGQSQSAAYKVPADYTHAYLKSWAAYYVGATANLTGEVLFKVQEPGEEGFSVRWSMPIGTGRYSHHEWDRNSMPVFPALSNIKVSINAISTSGPVGSQFTLAMVNRG